MECAGPLRLKLRSVCWIMHSEFRGNKRHREAVMDHRKKTPIERTYDFSFAKRRTAS